MWWVILAILAVVSVLPMAVFFVREKIQPATMNDRWAYFRLAFVVGWLAVGATVVLLWALYGVVLAIRAA
jgi:NADH:ubiquinone oxidoreductase subunit 5 (subunit L)/multisubunit Na+/H+ antiporter MnhA subunit